MRVKSMSAASAGFLLEVHCLEQASAPLAGDRCIYNKEPSPTNPPVADHLGSHNRQVPMLHICQQLSTSPQQVMSLQQEQRVS